MGKLKRFAITAALVGLIVGVAAAPSAAQAPGKTFMRKNIFYLPIKLEDRVRSSLHEVRLYMKDDPSKPWQLRDSVPPTQSFFAFRAERDGEYLFTVVTVDKQGQSLPPDVQREPPGLCVVLDTRPPTVQLHLLSKSADGQVVICEINDENIALEKTRFLYQTGDQVWRALESMPQEPQKFCIPAQAVLTGMVRVSVADAADNSVVHEVNLTSLPVADAEPAPAPALGRSAEPPTFTIDNGPAPVSVAPSPAKQPSVNTSGDKGGPAFPTEYIAKPEVGVSIPVPPAPAQPSIFDPPPRQQVTPLPAPKNLTPPMPPVEADEPPDSFPLQKISQRPREIFPAELQVVPEPITAEHRAMPPASAPNITPVSHQELPLNKHLVNKRQLFLQYQIDQQGASGVGRVEIWLTRDRGQTWERHGEDTDRQSPAEVMLPGEGLFGVSLVVSNGRGFGAAPPNPGDPADWWIEVDVTRPHAELLGVRPGSGEHTGTMAISWLARDSNLAPKSINLSCSTSPDGPWQAIARGLDNHGQYRWTVPVEVGPQAYIRLEAQDLAGNSIETRTEQPVLLDDLSRPRARIRAISTGASSMQPE